MQRLAASFTLKPDANRDVALRQLGTTWKIMGFVGWSGMENRAKVERLSRLTLPQLVVEFDSLNDMEKIAVRTVIANSHQASFAEWIDAPNA
jgi:hypothetical protein